MEDGPRLGKTSRWEWAGGQEGSGMRYHCMGEMATARMERALVCNIR